MCAQIENSRIILLGMRLFDRKKIQLTSVRDSLTELVTFRMLFDRQ